MIHAPHIVGNSEVVAYSPIDARHRPTSGSKHIVAGVMQGPAAGLAICRPKSGGGFFLFGCNDRWEVRTDSWFTTLEEAMSQAEFEHEGISSTWLNHEPAWELIGDNDRKTAWDFFYEQFDFKPSVKPEDWPGIKEPSPSATFDISNVFSGPAEGGAKEDEMTARLLALFRQCVLPGERLLSLDWQHQCYFFNPYGLFDLSEVCEKVIPVVPNGDYSIFLADDFRFGTFGHPWEQSICVFGEKLLSFVENEQPRIFERAIRRNGIRLPADH